MRFNIKKYVLAFFILIVTYIVASEQQIPNIKVFDNPKKKVTTIEGLKNRDHAEMNIKVKKREIEKIYGEENQNSIIFILLDNNQIKNNEKIKIVKSLDRLSNKKVKRNRQNNMKTNEISFVEKNINGTKIIKISKKDAQKINYIVKYDKNSRKIKKIYKGYIIDRYYKIIDIGCLEFKIDSRLKNNPDGFWLFSNGDFKYNISSETKKNYKEMLKVSGKFKKLNSSEIINIINIDDRMGETQEWYFNKIPYKVFYTSDIGSVDESAMPYKILLKELKSHIVISIKNSLVKPLLDNKFILLAGYKNIKKYKGNIKEVYDNSYLNIDGNGIIDIEKMPKGEQIEYKKSTKAGYILDKTKKYSMKLIGKLPQTQGYYNRNIVTKLNVNGNDNFGQTYSTTNYIISLENKTGNLQIKKLTDNSFNDNLKIDYYYNRCKLGSFTLHITNSPKFKIIGDDIIDFGKIIQGKEKKINTNILIENLNSLEVKNVNLDGKNGKTQIKLINKKKLRDNRDKTVINKLNVDTDINFIKSNPDKFKIDINLIAKPKQNQKIGEYEGELNLYIDIE